MTHKTSKFNVGDTVRPIAGSGVEHIFSSSKVRKVGGSAVYFEWRVLPIHQEHLELVPTVGQDSSTPLKPHKWSKEITAWAEGKGILFLSPDMKAWKETKNPAWYVPSWLFAIKGEEPVIKPPAKPYVGYVNLYDSKEVGAAPFFHKQGAVGCIRDTLQETKNCRRAGLKPRTFKITEILD